MKRTTKETDSELVHAASELDGHLRRFGEMVEELRQIQFTSQKKMQRATRMFQDLAEADCHLGGLAQKLIAALNQARELQQSQLEVLQARTREFESRSTMLQELLRRYGALGESAAGINALLQEAAAMPTASDLGQGDRAEKIAQVVVLMDAIVAQSRQLTHESLRENFQDVARLADSLGQQMLDARKKVQRIQRSMETGPNPWGPSAPDSPPENPESAG